MPTDSIDDPILNGPYEAPSLHFERPGGNDPYQRLKGALKAAIEEDAKDALCRPFPKPGTDKVAIKIIDNYGDEVVQDFEMNAEWKESP